VIAIIQRHNRLNGVTFAIVEFSLIALVVGTFAALYVIRGNIPYSLVTAGITANCLPVIIIGARMLRDPQIPPYWNKSAREQHLRENPKMLRDTLLLTTATLLPFVVLVAVLYETYCRSRSS
jgi:hypothetical protein